MQSLRAYDGDIVTEKYEDRTLPPTHAITDKLEIYDTLTVYYPLTDANQNPFIRIEDDSFSKQYLLTGKPILDLKSPVDFRESGDYVGFLYAYFSLGFVGIIVVFFIIKKWKNKCKPKTRKSKSQKKERMNIC